jgi:uncharacterized damage-inducible protein DinB
LTTMSTQAGAQPETAAEPLLTPPIPPVVRAGVALLDQASGLIRSAFDRSAYAAPSQVLPGGTIGKHIRHALDHFRAALDGRADVIDYDHRERDVPMETSPAAALQAIDDLCQQLAAIDQAQLQQPVRVRIMLSGSGDEAELTSTLGRELAFATHHAVHHHAMIRAIAAELGVQVGPDFGKAPSTINHEKCR